MIIAVTYDDISEGNASLDACPITIALRRHFGDKVSISRNFIRVNKKRKTKEKWKLISLPVVARNFLLDYHKHNSPQPFYFELSAKNVKALKAAS